jgi:hypothetical protein
MTTKTNRAGILLALASTLPAALSAQTAPKPADPSAGVTELEKFIVTESAAAVAGGLLPTSRSSDSVFGSAKSVLDIPRSVTVLTPELMQKLGVRSFDDIARVIPGHGPPGAATLLTELKHYLQELRGSVQSALQSGISLGQLAGVMTMGSRASWAKWSNWDGYPEQHIQNLQTLYLRLEQSWLQRP